MTTPRNPLKRVFHITKLRTELMLLIIIAIVLPSLALVVISTETSESALRSKMEETTNSSIHILDKTLTQLIQLESAGVNELAYQISSTDLTGNPAKARSLLDKFKLEHPEVDIIALGNDQGKYMFAPDSQPEDYDPRTRDWYIDALKTPESTSVIDPIFSKVTNSYILPVSRALPDGKGAVTISISMNRLMELTKNVSLGDSGYVYILDGNNKVIYHPTMEVASEATSQMLAEMGKGPAGKISYKDDTANTQMDGFYITNELTGFKMAGVLPENEYTKAVYPILYKSGIVLVVSLLLASIVTFLIIRRITGAVERLNRSAKRVSEGYLDESVETNRKDEIGQLAGNYNEMVSSLRKMVQEVAETSGHLAAASEQLTASTGENSKAVEYVTELVEESTRGVETQAYASAEVAITMDEMSTGIQKSPPPQR